MIPWFLELLQELHSKMVRKSSTTLPTSQKGPKCLCDQRARQQIKEFNRDLDECSKLTLKQPLPHKELVFMPDANSTTAGHAILNENDPN